MPTDDSPTSRTVPFAMMPHALAADPQLGPTDVRVALALLHWALDSDRCTAADWRLAGYAGVTEPTVQRSLRKLEAAGHIRLEKPRPHPKNMTGRVIVLRWREDPSYLPDPPDRSAPRPRAEPPGGGSLTHEGPSSARVTHQRGTIKDEGPSPVSERVNHRRVTGSLTGDRPGHSPVSDKEEGLEKVQHLSEKAGRVSAERLWRGQPRPRGKKGAELAEAEALGADDPTFLEAMAILEGVSRAGAEMTPGRALEAAGRLEALAPGLATAAAWRLVEAVANGFPLAEVALAYRERRRDPWREFTITGWLVGRPLQPGHFLGSRLTLAAKGKGPPVVALLDWRTKLKEKPEKL